MTRIFVGLAVAVTAAEELNGRHTIDPRPALRAFFKATGGSAWRDSSGWLGNGDPCTTWNGVGCLEGKVTSIILMNNSLSGSIPSQLSELASLEKLVLSHNSLRGTLPTELFSLKPMAYMNVVYNQLSGTLPLDLVHLDNLSFLALQNNPISGTLPLQLGKLTALEALFLGRYRRSALNPWASTAPTAVTRTRTHISRAHSTRTEHEQSSRHTAAPRSVAHYLPRSVT